MVRPSFVPLAICASLFGWALAPSVVNAQGDFPPEGTWYRFEEGDGADVVDDISGDPHGSFVGEGASYSADVPDIGSLNEFSADLSFGSWIEILDVGFALHDPVLGGGVAGDAYVEWWQKNSAHGHSSVFWTSTGGGDSNRFNIFWGATFAGPGREAIITGDFRNQAAQLDEIAAFMTVRPPVLEVDEWNHIRIERVEIGGSTWGWNWFYNGIPAEDQYRETTIDLPSDPTWLIGGRQGGDSMPMLIDEIRQGPTQEPSPCPRDGQPDDTRCTSISIDPPADPIPRAGKFVVTAEAADDSGGQTIAYTFSALNDLGDVMEVGPRPSNTATFDLGPGSWVITATVDDDRLCDDDGGGVTCEIDLEVGDPPGYPDQVWIRFEEGEGSEITAEVTRGDVTTEETIGRFEGGATHGFDTATLEGGPGNDFHADFLQGFAVIETIAFPFHDPITAAAAPGDVTLEWLMQVPNDHGHGSIWWTTFATGDGNRFNIFWNASFTGIADSDRFVDGDFRDPNGALETVGAPGHDTQLPIPLGEWVHFAITRTDIGDGSWEWTWYVNGELSPTQAGAITFGTLPSSKDWLICGRSQNHNLSAFMDEIRASQGLLDPDDFLKISGTACPTAGDEDFEDTLCTGLDINGPPNNGAGLFEVIVNAEDGAGDQLLQYFYRAESDLGEVITLGPTPESSANLNISEGLWDITVTVDDNILCTDDAAGSTCSETIEVGPPPPPPDQVYYRFEEGEGTQVVDSISGEVHGELQGGATFSPDTPDVTVPRTGAENLFSADFNAGMGLMTGVPYYHHDPQITGGSDDATVEFFMLVPQPHPHSSFIWSTAEDNADANRFNMFFNASFTGIPGSEEYVEGDYREPGGALAQIGAPNHDSLLPITTGEWHHFVIIRTGLGDGSWEWTWYVDGELSETQSGAVTFNLLPTATSWWICGRQGGHGLSALIDELRMTNRALNEEDFLIVPGGAAPCEPTEEAETACDDGSDNDCDGNVDDADSDCQGVGPFLRGDCDNNGSVGGSPTEAIVLLNFAFRGGAEPPCLAACDAEANGSIGITDALRILRHAFLGVGDPDAPFPDCARSTSATDVALGCNGPLCP